MPGSPRREKDVDPVVPARSTDEADRHALVAACVAEVAATLSKERTALVDALYRRLSSDIEPLRGDESLSRLMSGSIESNVSTFLDVLRYGIDVKGVEVPPTAVEYARRLAQHGVPVRALVRAYRLGQDSFLQRSFAVLNARVSDFWLVAAAGQLLTTTSFAYIDQVTERVFEAYEDERERWLRQRDAARDACVQELLRGDRVDLGAAERTLGYQLTGRRHVGLIVWTAQHEQSPAGA